MSPPARSSRLSPAVILSLLTVLAIVSAFGLPLIGRTTYRPAVYLTGVGASTAEGFENLSPEEAARGETLERQALIFWRERFPKTMLAMIAGGALALAGLTLQVLFRNPLASPYTLGIASGAAFGACFWLQFAPAGIGLLLGFSPVVWASFAGAALATGIVFALFRFRGLSTDQMLLAGIAVSFFFSSLILALQYATDPGRSFRMLRWTMGRIDPLSADRLLALGLLVLAAAGTLFFFARELDILLTGRDRAMTLGVNVDRFRLALFFLSSILVGAVVSVCGPIGFVGLMVPHLCRMLVGSEHRRLVPATALLGAIFLALCFTLSRSLLDGDILPVGILTSLLGGPFFLWLLLRQTSAPSSK